MNLAKQDAARRQYERDMRRVARDATKAARKGATPAQVRAAKDKAIAQARDKLDRAVRSGKPPALRTRVMRGDSTPRAVLLRVDNEVRAIPKEPRLENPHLLAMAKGKPCLFWWVPRCAGADTSTCVQAHENSLDAGKGTGYKAHDFRSARGCYWCHHEYDQGADYTYEEKQAAFRDAFRRQLAEWQQIAADPKTKPKDRAAAAWAIDNLAETQGACHV